jgi:VWFA-related protein
MTRAWLALALAVLPASAWAAADPQPVFTARTELVRVDVLVTADGQPVKGLAAEDFEVLDGGVPQRVELVSYEQLPLNVVLALDLSESVAGERLAHLTEAGHAALQGMSRGDQVALVTFTHAVRLGARLTTDTAAVRRALADPWPGGDTSLVDATYAAMLVGESDVGRALVIVFSDGVDTSSWLRPQAVLDVARRSDAVVYGVTVRGAPASPFLREIAERTGGRQFEVESTKDLGAAFARILEEFRQRYVIGYTPRDVPAGGWHPLTVRVKRQRATVRARPGYLAGER